MVDTWSALCLVCLVCIPSSSRLIAPNSVVVRLSCCQFSWDRVALVLLRKFSLLPPANEVWGKVIFSQASVILLTGGVCQGDPPARETPPPRRPPSPQGRPPRQGYHPARETPCQRRPLHQGDHPPPGRPPTRETPCQGDPHQGDPPPGRPPSLQGRPPAREIPPPRRPPPLQAPHPGGKFRGIRSRPTAKGEIQGDQIQAHT